MDAEEMKRRAQEAMQDPETQRKASLWGGGAGLLLGLARGGLPGLALGAAGAALMYRASTGRWPGRGGSADGTVRMRATVTVDRDRQTLFDYWRDFSNMPRFMQHIREVQPRGGGRARWVAELPVAGRVEWEAEVTGEDPGRRIAWASVPASPLHTEGEVRFQDAPADRGTEVQVDMLFQPPGAVGGRLVQGLSEQMLKEDLRRFKQLMETGEVSTAAMGGGQA